VGTSSGTLFKHGHKLNGRPIEALSILLETLDEIVTRDDLTCASRARFPVCAGTTLYLREPVVEINTARQL
jgi:hypothetical protein